MFNSKLFFSKNRQAALKTMKSPIPLVINRTKKNLISTNNEIGIRIEKRKTKASSTVNCLSSYALVFVAHLILWRKKAFSVDKACVLTVAALLLRNPMNFGDAFDAFCTKNKSSPEANCLLPSNSLVEK